jgi:hypothetical protein
VWVCKASADLDLPQKPLGTQGSSQLRAENLQRNGTLVLQILSEIDRGHPTTTDLPFDGVAVG